MLDTQDASKSEKREIDPADEIFSNENLDKVTLLFRKKQLQVLLMSIIILTMSLMGFEISTTILTGNDTVMVK